MKWIILSLAVVGITASSIQFTSLPKSITLSGNVLKSSKVSDLNANILGLTTNPVQGIEIETDLFSRPHAIAAFYVEGVDTVSDNAQSFTLEDNGLDLISLDSKLALTFGADREFAQTSRSGVSGSSIAGLATEQTVDASIIKTKIESLRSELVQVYKLAKAIRSQSAKFEISETADVYRVDIKSLSGLNLSDDERATAIADINNAVQELTSALSNVYGEQVVVEIIALSSAIKNAEVENHKISKRDVTPVTATDQKLAQYRKTFNVSVFTSSDYPAIFAIFLGTSLALVLAVLYATVGMMTMD
ncbi:unnamed protein product, partial [Auanema sp. JU1783]